MRPQVSSQAGLMYKHAIAVRIAEEERVADVCGHLLESQLAVAQIFRACLHPLFRDRAMVLEKIDQCFQAQ